MLEYQCHKSTNLDQDPVLKKLTQNNQGSIDDQLFTLKQEIINQSSTNLRALQKKDDDIRKLESLIQDYEQLNKDS